MAVMNGCCCCFSLRTGVIIIAILYLISSLLQVGTTANSLHNHQYIDKDTEDLRTAINNIDHLFSTDLKNQLKETADNIDSSFNLKGKDSVRASVDLTLSDPYVTKSQLITALVFAVIQAICGLLLLFGAIKEKAGLILPWVIVQTIVIIGSVVTSIFISVELFRSKDTVVAGYVLIAALIIYLTFGVYFLLVVYSLYQSLRENPRRYV